MNAHIKGIGGCLSVIVFIIVLFILPNEVGADSRIALALTGAALILWVTEAISIGQTSFLILLVIGFTRIVPFDVALSGFSSGAIFLIIAGMMIAKAVNGTPLTQRLTYFILLKCGSTPSKMLAAVILTAQVQAFFIPAAAVRATLLMPIVTSLLTSFDFKAYPNIRRQLMLGVAFGGNISGTAILPAAIGNVLAVEIVNMYTGTSISYFYWMLYAIPIWLLLIPTIWLIILKTYPAEVNDVSEIQEEMKNNFSAIGPWTIAEKKLVFTLALTVGLWMTESIHHLHPALPAIFAALLLSLPKIGVIKWEEIIKFNLETIIVLGITLSLGKVLNETGAIAYLGGLLHTDWLADHLQEPVLTVLLIVLITQIYHLFVSNVSTAVVTLLPVLLGLSLQIGINPLFVAYTAAITSLYGFIIVVETMSNIIVQNSGYLSQREFLLPGIWATIASIVITVVVAATWWKWLGFIPNS